MIHRITSNDGKIRVDIHMGFDTLSTEEAKALRDEIVAAVEKYEKAKS